MVCFLLRKTDCLLPFISSKWAERSFFTMTKMAAHLHYVAFQNTNRVQVLQSNKNIKKLLVKQPDKWQSWEFQVSLRKDKIFTRNIGESYLSSRSWVTVTIKWTFKSSFFMLQVWKTCLMDLLDPESYPPITCLRSTLTTRHNVHAEHWKTIQWPKQLLLFLFVWDQVFASQIKTKGEIC